MSSFEKLIEEFSYDYLGDSDNDKMSITLYDTPVKDYKEIYLRIRKNCDNCKIVPYFVGDGFQNIKILDIDL